MLNMSSKLLALQVIMAFYLHTDVIDVNLETIHSISDENGIITNDL